MKKLLLSLIFLSFFTSCGKDLGTKEDVEFADINSLIEEGDIKYSDIEKYVFEPHCSKCHSGLEGHWIVAGNPEGSELYEVLEEGEMPLNAPVLPEYLSDLVYEYILSL